MMVKAKQKHKGEEKLKGEKERKKKRGKKKEERRREKKLQSTRKEGQRRIKNKYKGTQNIESFQHKKQNNSKGRIRWLHCHHKRKGKYFLHCINPNVEHIETYMYYRSFTKTERFASSIISSSRSSQTPKFYCLISMDHKGSVSLLISSLGVNRLLHKSGSSYPTTKTPQRPTKQFHMIPLRDWTQI